MKHSKPKSYANQSFGVNAKDKERLDKLGKNFSSIDFEISDSITESNVGEKSTAIGKLIVGSSQIELTYSECNKIISTLADAQTIVKQKQRLGIF